MSNLLRKNDSDTSLKTPSSTRTEYKMHKTDISTILEDNLLMNIYLLAASSTDNDIYLLNKKSTPNSTCFLK
jgi:hypothetical protein